MSKNDTIKKDLRENPLRIGVSTRALFNLEEEHNVFQNEGLKEYIKLQRKRENDFLDKGAGFNVIEKLLLLNENSEKPYVEVILLSRNSPDLSLRAFKSIEEYSLSIKTGSFTSGRSIGPFIKPWNIDLFLSNEDSDVKAATDAGAAAAKFRKAPEQQTTVKSKEVRIAFDGDAVVFSPESDNIFKEQGLEKFIEHEKQNATKPMAGGPFGEFLKKLSKLREIYLNEKGTSLVRIIIVTARNAPSHARVVHTLRAWGTPADECHFVGSKDKTPLLEASGPHIFFDDQLKHVLGAQDIVAAGHVPGPHDPTKPVIPADE